MKRLIVSLFLVFSLTLSACGYNYISMKMGYKQGQYKVTEWKIRPANPEIENSPDYIKLKKSLEATLPKELAGKGSGREISITITINKAHISPNLLDQIILEPYYINSTLDYWDKETGQQIGSKEVYATSQAPDLISEMASLNDTKDYQRYEKDAISWYMHQLMQSIYPPQQK